MKYKNIEYSMCAMIIIYCNIMHIRARKVDIVKAVQ